MQINGASHMLVETAIILIDGLLFPVAHWPDIHRKALSVRNRLADWSDEKTTPTAHEWAEVMEDTIAIRDWLQERAQEAQTIIDNETPTRG